jgi:hypothetical protein
MVTTRYVPSTVRMLGGVADDETVCRLQHESGAIKISAEGEHEEGKSGRTLTFQYRLVATVADLCV